MTVGLKDKVFRFQIPFEFNILHEKEKYFEIVRYVAVGGLGVEVKTHTDQEGGQIVLIGNLKGTERGYWREAIGAYRFE